MTLFHGCDSRQRAEAAFLLFRKRWVAYDGEVQSIIVALFCFQHKNLQEYSFAFQIIYII